MTTEYILLNTSAYVIFLYLLHQFISSLATFYGR